MFKIIFSLIMVVQFSFSPAFASLSEAERIATVYRKQVEEAKQKQFEILTQIENQLMILKAEAEKSENLSTRLSRYTTRGSLALGIVAVVFFQYNGGGSIVNMQTLFFSGAFLALGTLTSFIDLLTDDDVSEEEFDKNYKELLIALAEYSKELIGDQRVAFNNLFLEFKNLNEVLDFQLKKENTKELLQKLSLVLATASLVSTGISLQTLNTTGMSASAIGMAISYLGLGASSFNNEDRKEIANALAQTIVQVQEAKILLQ